MSRQARTLLQARVPPRGQRLPRRRKLRPGRDEGADAVEQPANAAGRWYRWGLRSGGYTGRHAVCMIKQFYQHPPFIFGKRYGCQSGFQFGAVPGSGFPVRKASYTSARAIRPIRIRPGLRREVRPADGAGPPERCSVSDEEFAAPDSAVRSQSGAVPDDPEAGIGKVVVRHAGDHVRPVVLESA